MADENDYAAQLLAAVDAFTAKVQARIDAQTAKITDFQAQWDKVNKEMLALVQRPPAPG